MKKLLSLPPNLVECFHDITGYERKEWFCTSDPIGHKLGSGGGSAWLLWQAYQSEADGQTFDEWLAAERRLLLHAGGQSRRLPAYAPSGKVLTPIPIFRWERGQRLSQDLLSLQVPLYERIMQAAPRSMHTMIVSGDVLIRATQPLQPIPEADVVCYGLWLPATTASHHGVFVSDRQRPDVLKQMLQKPSMHTLGQLLKQHFYLTDIGVWLLSDKAVKVLMKKSQNVLPHHTEEQLGEAYDLYSDFGCALGTHPTLNDAEVNDLSVVVLPLPGGEFYHFGTSRELITSTMAIQNLVNDQRRIMHHDRKPHPAMFVQNAVTRVSIGEQNHHLWIENSWVGEHWTLASEIIITGVPRNDWHLTLKAGDCIDVVPVGEDEWVVRPYRFDDTFAGEAQQERRFPVVKTADEMERFLVHGEIPHGARLMSAEDISNEANLRRLTKQREELRATIWPVLAQNHQHSVFYQTDLDNAAQEFHRFQLPEPPPISDDEPLLKRIHDCMFRSELQRLNGKPHQEAEARAFSLLREGLTEQALQQKQRPRMSVYNDQIVWGRSPVRIDIAGGWTDTPPYCLMEGGNVINLAIELNGQPPLQTYIRPCKERHIVLRSIDLGAMEVVSTYEQLADFCRVGSPFSIPKAALVLAGFQPGFSEEAFASLDKQLEAFGCGIELTLLSAIPAGSGLGTSSLLASTVLGALNDFCGLAWDKNEIGCRTLVLEQLLTTGGGWQDQFGGLLQGVKLLQTEPGFQQSPVVRWLPNDLWVQPEYRACHLLYYTGITRTAKRILAEIVRRMFLNQHDELALLRQMKAHTLNMYEAIQRNQFDEMGRLVRKNWQQNQALDSGTNPDNVRRMTDLVDDLCLGYKLPGAGGGGYLYMIAKDPEAAVRIRQILLSQQTNANARFVDMSLSTKGLQVSRS